MVYFQIQKKINIKKIEEYFENVVIQIRGSLMQLNMKPVQTPSDIIYNLVRVL